jgi:hypothetical protein
MLPAGIKKSGNPAAAAKQRKRADGELIAAGF